MSDFDQFSAPVREQFQKMAKGDLFVVDIDGDDLYRHYLDSFPDGTNPIFRERTEHDCSNCKHFIRRVGMVIDQERHTVWDKAAIEAPYPHNVVAEAMAELVRAAPIDRVFRVKESGIGSAKTRGLSPSDQVERWNHFHTGSIPRKFRAASPGEAQGEYRTTVQVFQRGLDELTTEALETVLALIDANNLYRGEEHREKVAGFLAAQRLYLEAEDRDLFVWARAKDPATRFRNTAIGTLVQDLSEGTDLTRAVKKFETKGAPENYKRTTAVITPGMVKAAMETVTEMGLEPALERRFARVEDVSVNDVLWVDNTVQPLMAGGLGDMLMDHAQAAQGHDLDEKRAEDIPIDEFLADVLTDATAVEVLLRTAHLGNLMSLTAPVHPAPNQLFQWDNDFAWSYAGNLADSELRRRVSAAGGRVDGAFRFSHSWNHDRRNASLMDLHVFMPGSPILYSKPGTTNDRYGNNERVGWNNRQHPRSGGIQDVDYTDPAPKGYIPVENITFPDIARMPVGTYVCKIHNWSHRPPTEGGFQAEIEFGGQVFAYERERPLKHKEWVTVATVTLKDGEFTIEHHMECGTAAQEKWGLTSERFVKVNFVTLSPNHWGDNAVGNKHTLFVLDGAKNDESCRGIYNEFLHPRLIPHRKVFEVIGDKTKCQPTEGQLSGLGFSSTKPDSVIVRIDNQRLYRVRFGA